MGSVFALEMGKDLLDDQRIFDAGDDLDAAAAAVAGLDVDVAYKDVGQGREQDAEALKTRFRRCAQVIAARRSARVEPSADAAALTLLPLPRLAGVTCVRCALLGANTPWNRVKLTRGFGTKATRLGYVRGLQPHAGDRQFRFADRRGIVGPAATNAQ
jgi:hypothetical protein